jgi:hypothetical protein
MKDWTLEPVAEPQTTANPSDVTVRVDRVFEMRISLDYLQARIGDTLLIRFSVWENNLPLDALPPEGALRVKILSEEQIASLVIEHDWKA